MEKTMPRNAGIAALSAMAGLSLMLAGCSKTPEAQPSETATAADEAVTEAAGPDARPGISADKGRLVLAVIAGRPAAAYFTVHNNGTDAAELVGVHIADVGKAEMHKTEGGKMTSVESLSVAPGGTLEFGPGSLHVMAFEPSDALKGKTSTELTLTFSDGDKVSIPLAIETMGAGMTDDMSGMDHSGHEGMGDMEGMRH